MEEKTLMFEVREVREGMIRIEEKLNMIGNNYTGMEKRCDKIEEKMQWQSRTIMMQLLAILYLLIQYLMSKGV